MDINNMSAEQKKALKAQLLAEEKEQKEKKRADKEALKKMNDDFIDEYFPRLVAVSDSLKKEKDVIFDSARILLALKQQVLELSPEEMDKQQSHSISNADFSKTIIIGYNVIDKWDNDLTGAGLARVNKWLQDKMSDENKVLIGLITDLLKPNKEGQLNAARVLNLDNKANEIGDVELIEAVQTIKDGYRPAKSSTYVKAKMRDDRGQDVWVNLSMSNA